MKAFILISFSGLIIYMYYIIMSSSSYVGVVWYPHTPQKTDTNYILVCLAWMRRSIILLMDRIWSSEAIMLGMKSAKRFCSICWGRSLNDVDVAPHHNYDPLFYTNLPTPHTCTSIEGFFTQLEGYFRRNATLLAKKAEFVCMYVRTFQKNLWSLAYIGPT